MLKSKNGSLCVSSNVLMSILKEEDQHCEELFLVHFRQTEQPVASKLSHDRVKTVRHLLSCSYRLLLVVRMQELNCFCSWSRLAQLVEALPRLQS